KNSIKKGESVTLSWELSKHPWTYCNKFFGWDGGLKPINGSEESKPLFLEATFKLICYLESKAFEDAVIISILPEETVKKVEDTTQASPSSTFTLAPGGGFISCSVTVEPAIATLGKNAMEALWVIDSDPRSAFFYWRGKDNGVDIGKVYGGKTQRIRRFDYTPFSAKYERYAEIFFSQQHYVGDPYTPGCTTNTVVFEIKE
ncbi:MAG: hypothetical protein AAB522_02215, partial [Patescibacteria group bacterium]